MSSRVNVKQSKKDRPRSSDKLRKKDKAGSTPENTAPSDSVEGLGDADTQRAKPAIIDDEIRALQIKPEELEKLREPRPPSGRKKTPPPQPITVRKLKPASEWNKPKPRPVTIAKPAPQDAPLKEMDYTGAAGPRYDDFGQIVPHSILGSVDEFKRMAQLEGTIPFDESSGSGKAVGDKLTVKYEKKKEFPKFESVQESNALKNWQYKMRDRKRQQNNLAKLLNKAPDQLVMNQSDSYRQTQELRYLIDRTIPCMDYGKGYRVGSEFWKQQERIGDDLTGIHATMTQTEKGYPPPIEHIAVPRTVLGEKGTLWERPSTPCNKPWHRNAYLEERLRQLHPVMKELDPHHPEIGALEIIGDPARLKPVDVWRAESRQSTSTTGDVSPMDPDTDRADTDREPALDADKMQPVFGPSLQFGGQPARWTGDSGSFKEQVGLEARVSFEEYAGKRVTSFLEIVNDGTTAIFYDWKKVPKINPFEMAQAKKQRFYFNTGSGVILPGETMKFPFVFKSPNPGVFQEQWEFLTRPVVCGGAALIVTLRGVALQVDKYKQQRTELENDLKFREASQVVGDILNEILEGIREQERAPSPFEEPTIQEVFEQHNPTVKFHNERVKELENLYRATFPEEERKDVEWDLSVQTLQDRIMSLDEDDDDKQDYLERLNKALSYMSFPSFTPKAQQMYGVTYEALCEMVDNLVGNAIHLNTMLGMPERDADIPDDPSNTPPRSAKSRLSESRDGRDSAPRTGKISGLSQYSHSPFITPRSQVSTNSTSRRFSIKASAKSGVGSDRDKKTPQQKTKPDPKSKAPAKDVKPPVKTGKESAKSTVKSGNRSRSQKADDNDDDLAVGDPVLEAKYKDKLYSQSYLIVEESFDKLCDMLEDIQASSGGAQLPAML